MAAKDWIFTVNNYSPEELRSLAAELENVCSYYIIGKEKGEKGTPHLQGFLQLKNRTTLKNLKRKFLARAHLEKRKGSPSQASDYCKKEHDFIEFGNLSFQGKRNDLEEVKEAVKKGGMKTVVENFTFQQIRFAEKYLQYAGPKRDSPPLVIWLHGDTGFGKSRAARQITCDDRYVKNECSKWWPGYDGQTHVILDDFDDTWMPYQDLLSLLDRYERVVEIKGGNRQFLGTRIVITSQHPPTAYYGGSGKIDQLLRRITSIHHLATPEDWLDVCVKWPVRSTDQPIGSLKSPTPPGSPLLSVNLPSSPSLLSDEILSDSDSDDSGMETPPEELLKKKQKIMSNKN